MGGMGSTRWGGHTSATTVEQCAAFALSDLRVWDRGLTGGAWQWRAGAVLEWARSDGGTRRVLWRLAWRLAGDADGHPCAVLYSADAGAEQHEGVVALRWIRRPDGTRCPYLVCPRCGHLRRALYLVPGHAELACRRCHGLVYRSSQADLARTAARTCARIDARLGRYAARWAAPDGPLLV